MPSCWYLRPAALAIIGHLLANPPVKARHDSPYSRGIECDPVADYVGPDVDALANLFADEYRALSAITPYPQAEATELFAISNDEVLAALFGCPHGREWAFPEAAERRAAIRSNIALAMRVAA